MIKADINVDLRERGCEGMDSNWLRKRSNDRILRT
jgi:hypothetical protein